MVIVTRQVGNIHHHITENDQLTIQNDL
jgi:hypothetical protein